jgi:hypothetical protein
MFPSVDVTTPPSGGSPGPREVKFFRLACHRFVIRVVTTFGVVPCGWRCLFCR